MVSGLNPETLLQRQASASEPRWKPLSELEAQTRLRTYGPNVLPGTRKRTLLLIALETLREPMILLLVVTSIVYFLIGDLREAVAILASILVVIGISIFQKRRTERTLEALRDLTSPRALVMRAERTRRIPARDVVPGDVVIFGEGDRVPADAQLVESALLAIDESLLTGESFPVEKHAALADQTDNAAQVYSGSLVVRGHGIAVVTATGSLSEIGKIGVHLSTVVTESTTLEREISRIVRTFGLVSLVVCVLVAGIYGFVRGDWTKGAISALALAISMVPEEFPVVLTIFMALGAWRISQKKVLTRRFPAIEMLGSATVICVDKTGTLTENRMTVQEVFVAADGIGRDELLRVAALASEQHTADSVDKAVVAAAPGTQPPGPLLREYPLSPECMLVAKAYEYADHTVFIAAKGAPEQIFKLEPRQSESRIRCESALKQLTENGMRVIAVASGQFSNHHLPSDKSALKLNVLGLIGLADPIRATVPHAITELAGAGIRVIMITGDYPATASVIAGKAGLSHPENVISGKSLEDMDEAELRNHLRDCNVFARIRPEQKLQLVNALKANGEIVAMTGDGVNDAPALKAAHIGIAMGARGADVAREAASLVLSDDDFPAIADAVRLGRRIYDNLVKAVRYVFAAHVPIAGMAVLPVVFNWPILLMPLHIVFFELIVDPACSVAFESEADEPGIMRRLPRSPSARLFGSGTVWTGLLQGIGVFVAVLVAFGVALHRGQSADEARAIAFTTLVVGNLALIWANRSTTRAIYRTFALRNRALWAVTIGSLTTLLVILYLPQGRALFGFSFLHLIDLAVAFGLGLLTIVWCEILKLARRGKEGAYTRA